MKQPVLSPARSSRRRCIIGRRTSAWVPVRNTRPDSSSYLSSRVTAASAIGPPEPDSSDKVMRPDGTDNASASKHLWWKHSVPYRPAPAPKFQPLAPPRNSFDRLADPHLIH